MEIKRRWARTRRKVKEKEVGEGTKEETEQSNKEREEMGEELEIKLLSLQKKHKKPSWIWVTSFPLFLCTQTAQIHIFQRPNKTSDNVNIGHNVPASELTLWAAKGSFQRGNNEGRGIDSASSESSLPRKAFPVSSCSLVNEYELLTEGWPHRWSGKQSHFKPVACNSP